MALILSSCLSEGILSSLMFKPMKNINTIDELVQSNLTIVNYNHSWTWNVYLNQKIFRMSIDNNMRRIKDRLEYFSPDKFDDEVVYYECDILCEYLNLFLTFQTFMRQLIRKVANRELVFISEIGKALKQKYDNSDLSLKIGETKYYCILIGLPINKQIIVARITLLNT